MDPDKVLYAVNSLGVQRHNAPKDVFESIYPPVPVSARIVAGVMTRSQSIYVSLSDGSIWRIEPGEYWSRVNHKLRLPYKTKLIGLFVDSSDQVWARNRSHFSPKLEAYGDQSFYLVLNNGWVFALLKQPSGWILRLLENETPNVQDLSQVTPPFQAGVPNPRDLFGWHFRNLDNTGPNEGDVNAPQTVRLFQFSPEIAGTGGFKPSLGTEPIEASGRGWLKLIEYGLADLGLGQRASMNYVRFAACLTWPKTAQEQEAEADYNNLSFSAGEQEYFGQCGLNSSEYRLNPMDTRPRILSGDLDGDDAIDQVVRIERLNDGRRGIAVCRAGTWLHLFGFEEDADLIPTKNVAHVLSAFSVWYLQDADGLDVIVLERPEKGMAWLSWGRDEETFRWRDIYSVVTGEP